MKLDEEMRAALNLVIAGHIATFPGGQAIDDIFLAGYRMGLERAAKVCEDMQCGADAGDCAAAIREMAQ